MNLAHEPNHIELSYCYGGVVSYDPGEVLGPRILTDFELVMIIEGNPLYETTSGEYQLKPGSILLAHPNTTERYQWDKKVRTRHAYLHFDLKSVPQDWGELESWTNVHLNPSDTMLRLLQTIIDRAISRPDWPTEKPGPRQNRLMEAFLDLFLNFQENTVSGEESAYSEPVSRAVKFMRERLDAPVFEPFSLDEVSDAANTTSKNLCRVFVKEIGISPIKASRLMQLQLAIPLLARTQLSVKEISERCGFTDQLYFSRYFSSTFGMSPSVVREKLLSGNPPPHNSLPASLMPRLYW